MATGWAGMACAGALVLLPCAAARAGLDDYALGNGQNGATFAPPIANDYRLLTANAAVGATSITLDSNTGVNAGQLVLILQVRVANAGPGDSTTPLALDANGVGQLEYARLVANTGGTTWSLDKPLVRSYTSSAADPRVQVVRVREYTNVTVPNVGVATYSANRGGIFALMATGSVTLTGTTINASGGGFAGGALNTNNSTTGCTQIDSTSTTLTAQKGQSVFTFATTVRARGNRGTGGGGGVCLNSGGGGGGNGSAGGKGGGSAINNDGARDVGGFGGTAATGNLLMNATFGGGGGGGHQNATAGSAGARGGGMILIRANNILGTGTFLANGANGGAANSDGAGGGGGGGSVVLRAAATLQCTAITANGGNGGNVSVGTGGDGGGGGGGGGRVLVQATTGPSCAPTATPGLAGVANTAGALHFATGSNSVPPIAPGIVENPSPGVSFLLARLGNVDVVPMSQGTLVRFTTVAELGSAGFVVERVGASGYPLEPAFLRVAPLGFGGARYRALDHADAPGSYRILEIDRDGRRSVLGTFGASRHTAAPEPPDAQLLMAMAPGPQLRPYAPAPRATEVARARLARPATVEDTLWRVSLPALAPLLRVSDAAALNLAHRGELLVSHEGESLTYAVDDTDLLLRVPGEPQPKQRPESVVFVTGGAGRVRPLSTSASVGMPTREPERHRLDVDVIPALAASSNADADFWMSAYVSAESPDTSSASFVVPLEDGADDATVEVELAPAFGPWHAGGEVALEWNGATLGTYTVPSVRSIVHATVPASTLVAGDNTLAIVALAVPEGPTGLFANSVLVTARARALLPPGHPARHFAIGDRAVIAGGHGAIAAVESAGDVQFIALDGGSAAVRTLGGGTVLLATPFDDVTLTHAGQPPKLAADVTSVIMTHRGLVTEAEALAARQTEEGHPAEVVLADDLYDTLSEGHISARAITRFLRAERARGVDVRFLTLFGRGDFSPSSWSEPALPPLLIGTGEGIFSSDHELVDLDDDGAADLAVGRVPAATAEEAARYLSRRASFVALPDLAGQPALFISDRSSGDFHFDEDAERARLERPNEADTAIALDAVDVATARTALFATAASGLRLIDFVGHGGMDWLGADGLITTADVAALGSSPAVMVALTCVAARTELGSVRVIGEQLLFGGDAGPVAVVSATGLVHHAEAAALNAALLRALRERTTETLGEVVMQAGRAAGRAAAVTVLLGDPTLRVATVADADIGTGTGERAPVSADSTPQETQPNPPAREVVPTTGCAAGAGGTWAVALLALGLRRRAWR